MHLIEEKPLISRYRLKARGFLNSISNRRIFEGALIKHNGGYGCIHPWPELGDPPLEKCLQDLAGPKSRSIVRRALRCAEFDSAARQFEHSLFEEMEIPESHATLTGLSLKEVEAAISAGFTVIKMKCGRDMEQEAKQLVDISVEYPSIRYRLDFNETPTPDEVTAFLTNLPDKVRASIDFVEDPCPYSDSAWKEIRSKARVKLAVDRESAPLSSSAQIMVVKPAVDEPFLLGEAAIANQQQVVITSYMDHPVGQTFAAWEAARLGLQFPGLVGMCGLKTHHLFEPDAFTEALGAWSPTFTPPNGYGLGFDDLLEEQPWTRLY